MTTVDLTDASAGTLRSEATRDAARCRGRACGDWLLSTFEFRPAHSRCRECRRRRAVGATTSDVAFAIPTLRQPSWLVPTTICSSVVEKQARETLGTSGPQCATSL